MVANGSFIQRLPRGPGSPFRLARQCASDTKNAHPTSAKLQVERYFAPTESSIARLRVNDGTPRIRALTHLGVKKIHDVYYDAHAFDRGSVRSAYSDSSEGTNNEFLNDSEDTTLMEEGIYIRMRNEHLEAKVHQGDGRMTRDCVELHGDQEIFQYLEKRLGRPMAFHRLDEVANMHTKREEWSAGEYKIIVDKTDIADDEFKDDDGCLLITGKVKLFNVVQVGEENEGRRKANRRVREFMRKHEWAFPGRGEEAKDKLTTCEEFQAWDRQRLDDLINNRPNPG